MKQLFSRAVVRDIAIRAGGFGFDFWADPAVNSVVKRTGCRCGRSGVRFPGSLNRHSIANGSPPLHRICVPQAISRGDGPQWLAHGRGRVGSQSSLDLTIAEKMKPFFFGTNLLFFVRSLSKLLSCFFCFVQLFKFNLKKLSLGCDATIAVVQLF